MDMVVLCDGKLRGKTAKLFMEIKNYAENTKISKRVRGQLLKILDLYTTCLHINMS